MKAEWLNGIGVLLEDGGTKLQGRRIGLVAHPASIDAYGCPTATRLHALRGLEIAALFSPEHGFFGIAGAGDHVASISHPSWNIPVYSLYGDSRRPTAQMLSGLDVLVYDLQDLAVRCYTYVSTLRYIMEEAAKHHLPLIVTDRGNPLAHVVDGPMLSAKHTSFVGCFPGPLVYGLTSGEAALWMKKALKLDLDLHVVPMRGYQHGFISADGAHRWVSPSPSIRNLHTALCYPVTVAFEALPAVDHGRKTLMPFELVGMTGVDENKLAALLHKQQLPGMAFYPVVYENGGQVYHGVRIAVHDPHVYQPAAASVALLYVLQELLGADRLWKTEGSREPFFDLLFGNDSVRCELQSGRYWKDIVQGWPLQAWRQARKEMLLYPELNAP